MLMCKLLLSWPTWPTLANSGDVGSRRRQLFRKYGSPPPPPSSPIDQNFHFRQKSSWIFSTVWIKCNRNLRRWDNRSCFCLDFPETAPHIYADWTDISADDFQLALHPIFALEITSLVDKPAYTKIMQKFRLEICQKICTTKYLGQKLYTLKVRKLRLFLLIKTQQKWIYINYFSSFFVKI